jgi:methyltransferase-like protein/2-polyprenyl-3-methyl-5-hydroxy-6-metoxy-1,4-benzoquinol methylase
MGDDTHEVVSAIEGSYDAVPYSSHAYPQTHPRHLATVASLFGMTPAPLESMSVLELGCASGGNIIPIAAAFPGARVVGVDLSRVQVDAGRETVEQLGLENCWLEHADVRSIDAAWGSFDYIICHGVFSWVPSEVQDAILSICRNNLSASGVAYISYNAYPGWHLRGMIRDMMLYHADRFADPVVRVEQARALLQFLFDASSTDTAYGRALRAESELLRNQPDSYIFHEHLERSNQPLYFHEFVSHIARFDLQYLGESEVRTMMPASFPSGVQESLERVAGDQLQAEQYMDFLRNRMFRQTLICHRSQRLDRRLDPAGIDRYWLAMSARDERQAEDEEPVYAAGGSKLALRDALIAAALAHLSTSWPASVHFDELLAAARSSLPVEAARTEAEARATLAAHVLRLYMTLPLLELSISAPELSSTISERPEAPRLARAQAAQGAEVTNLRHRPMRLTAAERHVLRLLDGSRTRSDLVAELSKSIRAGTLQVRDGSDVSDDAKLAAVCDRALDQVLPRLARAALLVR